MSWLCEWKPQFKAEGSSRCVYEIEPTEASAKLTLTHSIERPDSKFIGAVSEGWPMVLSNLIPRRVFQTNTQWQTFYAYCEGKFRTS